ncbi:MAG: dioxygenase, partial [Acidimicrobiales bacterium]|nr:dioxygenase [Acidimicrobiales bacterium]
SGFSYHNLRGMDPSYAEPSERFDAWLAQAMTSAPDERAEALTHWVDAPAARIAHPREEHLLPAMVIAGAAGSDPVVHTYDDHVMGIKVSGFAAGTPAAA